MYLGIPQIIMLGLYILGLGISIARHGKPRSDENAGVTFLGTIIGIVILYCGGFFSK